MNAIESPEGATPDPPVAGAAPVSARVTIRIDFGPGRQLGHGKVRLLEMVDAHGSISQAARAMGMSYRRAWLLMDDVNGMFDAPALETQLGGKGGGHARLTDFGRRLIALYRGMEQDATGRFGSEIAALAASAKPSGG